MKRIFLTSGMVICLTCSAFADLGIVTVDNSTTPPTVTAVSNAGCDNSTLGVTSGQVNLQAVWEAQTYTVSYNCGGVTLGTGANAQVIVAKGSPNSLTVTYDGSYVLNNGSGCSLRGYTFGGWSCSTDLPGVNKTLPTSADISPDNLYAHNTSPSNISALSLYAGGASGTWTLTTNVTCTATWKANVINLTWKNGETTHGTNTCFYNGAVTLPSNPTRPGYTFAGWEVVNNTSNS